MSSILPQIPRLFDLEVSKGSIPGYTPIAIGGVNPTVGATFETLWDAGGNFVYPTSGETWEVLSDNTNDTSAGTGARTVLISGLDDSYVEQVESVTMDGTTPVVTTRTDWFRITSVTVISSGTSQKNEGSITLRVSGGGAIRSLIRPELSTTFNGFFTVPAGKILLIQQAQVFIPKNEDIILRNIFLIDGTNTFLSGGDVSVYQNSGTSIFKAIPVLPAKTDLQSTVKSTNTAVEVSLLIEGKLAKGASSPSIMINTF